MEVEADPDYEVLETREKVKNGVAIHEAEVLVAAGRGVKQEADLAMFRELAELIGGAPDRSERHNGQTQVHTQRRHIRLCAVHGRHAEGRDRRHHKHLCRRRTL